MKAENILIESIVENNLLSPEMKKALWKTLALIDQPGYGMKHFFDLIDAVFSKEKFSGSSGSQQEKEIIKTFKQVDQCLQILFSLGNEEQNIKPAYLATERVLLKAWGLLYELSLCNNKAVIEEYKLFWSTFLKISEEFYNKVAPLCRGRDGLSRFDMQDEFEYPLRIFDTMGLFGVMGVTLSSFENQKGLSESVASDLMQLIQNNAPARTPLYDSHAIDILLATHFLLLQGYKEFVLGWIRDIISRASFAYEISGRHFPIWTDSYDALLRLKSMQGEEKIQKKQELTKASTLFPMLATLYVALEEDEVYTELSDLLHKVFPHTELQIWYPDATTEEMLYQGFAGGTGTVLRVSALPSKAEEFKEVLLRAKEASFDSSAFSCFKHGFPPLALLANRHYRTPVLPSLLQNLLR